MKEIRELIVRMATEKSSSGYARIQGELSPWTLMRSPGYDNAMRLLSTLVLFLTSAIGALKAQELSPFEKQAEKIQYRIVDDGRLQIKPDASSGADDAPFTDIVNPTFTNAFSNAGTTGWLAIAYQGDTDLASMADVETILGCLNRLAPAKLFELIASEKKEPYHEVLLRLYAVRYVAQKGIKPAADVLEKALKNGISDPHVRRAAKQSLAELRGESVQLKSRAQLPLAKFLGQTSGRIDFVLQYNMSRMPAAHRLLAWGRAAAIKTTQRHVAEAGGRISLSQVAGGYQVAMAPAVAPYEAARRFGNHRVSRVIQAGRMGSNDEPAGANWGRVEGVFDIDRLYAGLQQTDHKNAIGKDDYRIEASVDESSFVVTRSAIVMKPEKSSDVPPVDHTDLIAAVQSDDAPIVAYIREGASLPGLPPQIAKLGIPRRIALWIPRTPDEPLRLRVTCPTTQMAGMLKAQAKNAPRQIEFLLQDTPGLFVDAMEPVLDALAEMKVEVEGTTVTASMSVKGIDLEAIVRAMR